MKINPDLCEMIHIINKRKDNSTYKIHGQSLQQTKKAKYLGVTIDSILSWNPHLATMAKEANNTVSFLKKELVMPQRRQATSNKSLVWP